MINRKSLMISTMLMSAMGVGGGGVWAADVQCLKTPSCEELGYTEVACFQNNGVKCPYGDKYFCVCPMNYNFTCTGENQTGGVGEACNGKYAACSCTSGLMWNDGACDENCPIGSILFNDFTCSDNVVSGKTPIGVVVYKDGKGGGQALALESIGNYAWGGYGLNITALPNISVVDPSDYNSCSNTAIITADGNNSTYPAAWAAYGYNTEGTSAGDWCLPAAGIFSSIYSNQEAINTGFSRAGGTQFTTSTYAWSSSVYSEYGAWHSDFAYTYGLSGILRNEDNEIRPVIGFCDDAENYTYAQMTDSCVKDGVCHLGSIFYSDKTCSMKLKDGKTPIGIVVYIDGTGGGQAMALESLGNYTWGGEGTDISTLTNYSLPSDASTDYDSCGNTAKIIAAGDKSTYPAAWAAHEYKTAGTSAGDWCLPAAGIITLSHRYFRIINNLFKKIGGTSFSSYAWSSSEYSSHYVWTSDFSHSYGLNYSSKGGSHVVRPVIEF